MRRHVMRSAGDNDAGKAGRNTLPGSAGDNDAGKAGRNTLPGQTLPTLPRGAAIAITGPTLPHAFFNTTPARVHSLCFVFRSSCLRRYATTALFAAGQCGTTAEPDDDIDDDDESDDESMEAASVEVSGTGGASEWWANLLPMASGSCEWWANLLPVASGRRLGRMASMARRMRAFCFVIVADT